MITAVSLNPCIDKTVSLKKFDIEGTNRVRAVRADIGGKGMNVAIALSNLGQETALVGFDFLQSGSTLSSLLTAHHVTHKLIPVWGALRTNLKIFEEETGHTIELNEYGAPVTNQDLSRVQEAILQAAMKSEVMIFSGSLPQGAPDTLYGDLCRQIREKASCRVYVDASGQCLKEALQAAPDLIKPNAQEFSSIVGDMPQSEEEILLACKKVIKDTGVGRICLSLGAKGAYLVASNSACFCPALKVPVRGATSAGDAMLSAVTIALCAGKPDAECLRDGTAAAAASIQLEGTQMCTRESFERLLPRVKVEQIE